MQSEIHSSSSLSRRDTLRLTFGTLLAACLPGIAQAIPTRSIRPAAILNAIASQLPLIPRSSWDRTPPNRARLSSAGRYSRITVHHEGTSPFYATSHTYVARELRTILGSHRARRYGDIAYHLVLDYTGRVWEARSLSYEGAHVLSNNSGNIGILLLGNFERQRPSSAQIAALDELCRVLRSSCGIPRSRIYGHRDLSPSVCPGRQLYPYVSQLRHT